MALLASAVLSVSCTSVDERPPSAGGGKPSPSPSRTEGPLVFVLADEYEVGEKIAVRLRNNGERSYIYNSAYEACDMRYFDESGRRFIIPPGTHCDIVANDKIDPGESVVLFEWKLNECVKDRWGCVKAEPLDPGTYRMAGRFRAVGEGEPVRVEGAFDVVASHMPANREPCAKGYETRREIAQGRFLRTEWTLSFYRGETGTPCLANRWSAYGSLFGFRSRGGEPHLAMLNLASTSPPGIGHSAYVMDGYVSHRVARLTFTLDGMTESVRIVDPPTSTELEKRLFIHFVVGERFDRDRTSSLRAFAANGALLASEVLRRAQFFPAVRLDGTSRRH